MSELIVVIGGYSTSRRLMEPVGNAAIELGLAKDVAILTQREANNNPERLRKIARQQLILPFSAGVVAVANASDIQPDRIVACHGPEPRNLYEQTRALGLKSLDSSIRSVLGRNRSDHQKIILGHTSEYLQHSTDYLKQLGRICGFSTFNQLRYWQTRGIEAEAVVAKNDVFFPYNAADIPADLKVTAYDGNHDALLLDPARLLSHLAVDPQPAETPPITQIAA